MIKKAYQKNGSHKFKSYNIVGNYNSAPYDRFGNKSRGWDVGSHKILEGFFLITNWF